jgi:hypothetical protein
MFTCILCRFAQPLDDVVLRRGTAGCVCLGCFTRATNSDRPMPKALRQQLATVLAALPVPTDVLGYRPCGVMRCHAAPAASLAVDRLND